MRTFDKNLVDQKFEESEAELCEGFGLSLLITAFDQVILEKIASLFCAQSSLAFIGVEAGIECHIKSIDTPDQRPGVRVSLWVIKNEESTHASLDLLYKHLNRRIRTVLFQFVGVRVFNHYYENNGAIPSFDSFTWLFDFSGVHTKAVLKYKREMVVIPMMGGDFEIEKKLTPQPGFLGGNILVYHTDQENPYRIEAELRSTLLKCQGISVIYLNAAAGSEFSADNGSDNPKKDRAVVSNFNYCPSLNEALDLNLPKDVQCITELVINGFYLEDIEEALAKCCEILVCTKNIARIRLGSYQCRLGKIHITREKIKALIRK